jgi:broad specificity phosphatase PhoE
MNNTTVISLVRHGQVHNPDGLFYGRLPGFGLSDTGYTEATRVAQALSAEPLAALYSSPLLRARQTAKEIGRFHGNLCMRVSRLINEVHTAFEGCVMKKVESLPQEVYASADPRFDQPHTVFERFNRFAVRLLRMYPGKHVAAVTHGDVIAFACIGALGLPLTVESKTKLADFGFPDTYPATGSITTFTYHAGSSSDQPDIHYCRTD